MLLLTWLSIGLLAYIYIGYPLLLRLVVGVRGPRAVRRRDITPAVSLVISAYNEAGVIRKKLVNALELQYPRERLEIVVVSDASTDGTDGIVREFDSHGVRLARQDARRGKTAGLNAVVPSLRGEIVVFSDANAIYEPDAIAKLVRNFADPQVGCVTGEARYVKGERETAAQLGERAYWDYEIQQKRLETAAGSMVGGDGAIYAIRRDLWRTLPENAINDFLNPLQIVEAGWRGVYEPDAICYEETAGRTRREYSRRVRIVSRSWRAVFQAPGVLNPFRVGFFAISVISHKVLRWWSALFVLVALIGALWQLVPVLPALSPVVPGAVALVFVTAMAFHAPRRAVSLATYFAVIQGASLVGIAAGSLGRVSGVWQPPRGGGSAARHPLHPVLLLTIGVGVAVAAWLAALGPEWVVVSVFWSAVSALAYVFVFYPVLMAALAALHRRPVAKQPSTPAAALLIVANDEEAVIDAKIQNSLRLDYPSAKLRIVVASDGSVDGTNAIVRSYEAAGVELLAFPERRGKMSTINAAVEAIRDVDVIVFSDANVFLQPGAIRALVSNLADPEVGGVSGDVILVGERAALGVPEDLYYLYERSLQASESALGSMIGVDGALYAVRRQAFSLQPSDTILDDMAIPMAVIQQGYRVVFEPQAIAIEQGSQSAWEEFARKTRVVAGAAQFLVRSWNHLPLRQPQVLFSFFSHKVLRWLSPSLTLITLACATALAGSAPGYTAVAAAQGSVLLVGLAGCIPQLRRLWPVGLAHYYCLVQTAAIMGFLRGLRGSQEPAWERFARVPVENTLPAGVVRTGGAL